MSEKATPEMPTGPPPSKHKPDKIRAYKNAATQELKAHIFFPEDMRRSESRSGFVFLSSWRLGNGRSWLGL